VPRSISYETKQHLQSTVAAAAGRAVAAGAGWHINSEFVAPAPSLRKMSGHLRAPLLLASQLNYFALAFVALDAGGGSSS
jgi:hypothetical protein